MYRKPFRRHAGIHPHPTALSSTGHRANVTPSASPAPMSLPRPLVYGLSLAALALATWRVLDQAGPQARWVAAEAPAQAALHQPFPIRLQLRDAAATIGQLRVDLHGFSPQGKPQRFLTRAGAVPLQPGITDYTFTATLPAGQPLGSINVVVFVTPDGQWSTHTRAAYSDRIPILTTPSGPASPALRPLRLHSVDTSPSRTPEPSAAGRIVLGCLLASAALLVAAGDARSTVLPGSPSPASPPRLRWGLAIALACSGAWEFSRLGTRLHDALQASAQVHQLYASRGPVQLALTTGLVLTMAGLACAILRRPGPVPRRVALAAWIGHAGLSFLAAASLHALDTLASPTWLTLSRLQWAKLACATVAVAAAGIAVLRVPPQS